MFLVLAPLAILAAELGCHSAHKPRPHPPATPNQVLYERGRALIEQGKFAKARETLSDIGAREVQDPKLDPLVKLAIADAYFYDAGIANNIEAQSRYQQFVTFYPTHEMAGYAQFQYAMCYLKQSPEPYHDQDNTRRALEEFDKVRSVGPQSRFVAAAAELRKRCLQKLAKHDFQVGIFYYKRKKYTGAISRFKNLLDSYSGFDQTDAVYYYLGSSLVLTGEEAEGRLYLEKVQRDFPNSRWASKAKAIPEKKPA